MPGMPRATSRTWQRGAGMSRLPRRSPAYCHPGFLVGPLSGSPSDNNGPQLNGCGTTAEDDGIISLSPQETATASPTKTMVLDSNICHNLNSPPMTPCVSCMDGPDFPLEDTCELDDDSADTNGFKLTVHSLSRQALCLLWHQRLGHLNFR